MNRRYYRKSDVETHRQGYNSHGYPAINVKVYHTPVNEVRAHFPEATEEQIEKACEYAFESFQEQFWEEWQDNADKYFPTDRHVKVYSEGRSGGWLIVQGLRDIEDWDAIDLMRWRRFEVDVKRSVEWSCEAEQWIDMIEANQWIEPGAERFNMIDTPDGAMSLYEYAVKHI